MTLDGKMFDGVRVLELSAWVMVPGSSVLLSDLGAEVIKVEHPRSGDPARGLVTGGVTPAAGSVNMMVEQVNRGKRSVGLDVAHPEGRAILGELAANADIFLTSLLPEVRRKLGVDVDDMRAHNPSLIYAKADAVGARGPEAGKPGFDAAVFFGRAGILNSFATPGAEGLPNPRPGFGDKTAALSLAFGMASALFKRERTGEPSVVDVSLLGAAMWVASSDIIYSSVLGQDFSTVERPATNPISNKYLTKDGRWITLAMLASDRWWPDLCHHIDRSDLTNDSRFVDAAARAENTAECVAELETTFASANGIGLRLDLGVRKAEDRPVERDVLAPREVGQEPGAQIEQRRDASAHGDRSVGRGQDAGDHLQERALAGAVVAAETEHLPAAHLERRVLDRPEILVVGTHPAQEANDRLLRRHRPPPPAPVALPDTVETQNLVAHSVSVASRLQASPVPITKAAR